MTNFIGQTIRDYEIRELIGSGGHGTVYKALQLSVKREVALKIISPEVLQEPGFTRRFEAEAHIIANLEHPHIVPLYDYWQDAQGVFLVMRYIRQGSLRKLLEETGAQNPHALARIMNQIAGALYTAHQAGVVHRDVKPDNILLDELGNAYLTDFGIAKNLQPLAEFPATPLITETHLIVGTPAYSAPEQLEGRPVSPKTDIYALGVVLFELISGQHPFGNKSPVEMMVNHLRDPIPSLQSLRSLDALDSGLTKRLDMIIARATAKSTEDRYSDMLQLAADVHKALQHDAAEKSNRTVQESLLPVGQLASTQEIAQAPPTKAPPVKTMPVSNQHEQSRISPRQVDRNRFYMLRNLRTFWIDGVLNNSLQGALLMALGMTHQPGKVQTNWDVQLRNVGSSDTPLAPGTNIVDVFDQHNGKLLILGAPGSGKTTALLELARALLDRADKDPAHPIPMILNLSSWAQKQLPFDEWIKHELHAKYQVPRRLARAWVEDDDLLLLLDGLDEVQADARNSCVQAINVYRQEHGFVDIAVCSRLEDYEALGAAGRIHLNHAVALVPLDDAQIEAYLAPFGEPLKVVRLLLAEDDGLRELCRSPLMLSITALAYRDSEPEIALSAESEDARRQQLFTLYVQQMLARRHGTQYTAAQTQHYLTWLAQQMQQFGQSVFLIEGMQPDWLGREQRPDYRTVLTGTLIGVHFIVALSVLLITELLGYQNPFGFILQFLFIAMYWGWLLAGNLWRWYTGVLLIGVLGAAGRLYTLLQEQNVTVAGITDILIFIIPPILIYGVGLWLFRRNGLKPQQIKVAEYIRFSRRALRWWVVLPGIIIGFGRAVLNYTTSPDIVSLIIGTLGGATATTLIFIYLTGLVSDQIPQQTYPNQGIIESFYMGLRFWLILLPLFSLMFILPDLPFDTLQSSAVRQLVNIVMISFHGFIIGGGYTAIQHFILRVLLYRKGVIPWNYADFLDHAASQILLRKVGGSYIFIHRYLLEHFASQPR